MPQVNSCIQLLEGHYTFIKVASKGLFFMSHRFNSSRETECAEVVTPHTNHQLEKGYVFKSLL